MKKLITVLIGIIFSVTTFAQQTKIDLQKVETLLKQMTLEEKVGQMTQVRLAVFAKGGWGNLDGELDPALLKNADAIHGQTYTLGSTLFPQNIAMSATRNPAK